MNAERIDILMATYNGEAFLPQQIRSLQNQTYANWRLLVHDDGSTDRTVDIIEEFAKYDARICFIRDGMHYKNPASNFLSLLVHAHSPYCIFCDQDDIWLENKLEVLYEVIRLENPDIPVAVYSNSFIYEPERAEIGGRATLATPACLQDVLFMNAGVQGCAILFNRALRNICVQRPDFVCMHDHLITLAAITFGRFVYIDKCLMLYRRYTGTVTGYTDKSLTARLHNFFQSGKTVLDAQHEKAIRAFYCHYLDWISLPNRKIFEEFFAFRKRKKWSNILSVCKYGFNLYGKKSILIFKLLVRPL